MNNSRQSHFFHKQEHGNGLLIALAISIVAALAITGISVSQLGMLNSRQAVSIEKSSEKYYCARGGIQETLASRMVPRTNRRALKGIEAEPYNPSSGVCKIAPDKKLGIYRILVLGGDPNRDVNGNFSDEGKPPGDVIRQPFYIVSQGAVCRNPKTREPGINVIDVRDNGEVYCKGSTHTLLDKVTLISKVDFSRNNPSKSDRVEGLRVAIDPNKFSLETPVWQPCRSGNGISTDVNFNEAFQCNVFPNLHRVAFYQSGQTTAQNVIVDQAGPFTSTSPGPIVPGTSYIRLVYNGPIDYRTLYGANMAACFTNPGQCNVQVVKVNTNTTNPTSNTESTECSSSEPEVCCADYADTSIDNKLPGTAPRNELLKGNTCLKTCEERLAEIESQAGAGGTLTNEQASEFIQLQAAQKAIQLKNLSLGAGTSCNTASSGGTNTNTTQTPVRATLIPGLPGSTQVLIATATTLTAGQYKIVIKGLKDFFGNPQTGKIEVPFKVGTAVATTPPSSAPPPIGIDTPECNRWVNDSPLICNMPPPAGPPCHWVCVDSIDTGL
jgi:hypothetical protein